LKSPSGVRSPGKFSGPLEAKIKYGVYTLRGGKPVGLPPRSFSMRYGLDCGILIDHWSVLAAVFYARFIFVRHDHDWSASMCCDALGCRAEQCPGETTQTAGTDHGQARRFGFSNDRVHGHPVNNF